MNVQKRKQGSHVKETILVNRRGERMQKWKTFESGESLEGKSREKVTNLGRKTELNHRRVGITELGNPVGGGGKLNLAEKDQAFQKKKKRPLEGGCRG